MSLKNTNPLHHQQVEIVALSGRFRPNAAGTIDNTLNKGVGFTASWVSTGRYRVTFDQIGKELVFAVPSLMLAANDDKYIKLGPYDATNKRLDFFVHDISGAALADLASDPDTWIGFEVHWQNTKIKKGSKKLS